MAGQIPGGADDAPDLAIAELSEETTPPLCSLRRWLWVWDRRQWPPQPFGHNFSPLLCALFAILFATNRVRVLCVVCAVRQFACCWLPLRFAPLAAGCFLCHRTLDGLGQDVCGHGGGVFARLPWTVFGGWRAPRGTGECGLLGNCGWIGCFSQPQCHSRYSSPFPSPQRHFFPPSSRTSLMRKLPTVAGGGAASSPSLPPFPV